MVDTSRIPFCLQVNQQLDELTSAVTDLVRLYKDGVQNPIESCGDAKNRVFLSQLDLGGLEAVEQKYTQALTAFTKKQFFEVSDKSFLNCQVICTLSSHFYRFKISIFRDTYFLLLFIKLFYYVSLSYKIRTTLGKQRIMNIV